MKNILLFGAGRSATSLIQYLLKQAEVYGWELGVIDQDLDLARAKIGGHERAWAKALEIGQAEQRGEAIAWADVVISMLPAFLHQVVAEDCLRLGKHLCTASYVSADLQALAAEIEAKGLVFLCELGLDPGLDHLSAMQLLDEIRAKAGLVQRFFSATGGLVAPRSDDNPWHYKFSWNPRNVVLAGQGVARYLGEGGVKLLPYQRLFAEAQPMDLGDWGLYEWYPNRDSLSYVERYGLQGADTVLRATLRKAGFCSAWALLVRLGLTDDAYQLDCAGWTYADFFDGFMPLAKGRSREAILREVLGARQVEVEALAWLGLWSSDLIGLVRASPAQILLQLLEAKWPLKAGDADLVIMRHEVVYALPNGERWLHKASLYQEGDERDTAMSRLVGLPLAMGVKHLMLGQINRAGIQLPLTAEIYEPILAELQEMGIGFVVEEQRLD